MRLQENKSDENEEEEKEEQAKVHMKNLTIITMF